MGADRWRDALSFGGPSAGLIAIGRGGARLETGVLDAVLPWASVTKLVTAIAVLRDVDEGRLSLDEPAGPPGATVRHLLAHASGLPFEGDQAISAPEATRIYSNAGFERLGALLAQTHGVGLERVLATRVLEPLGMHETRLVGGAADGLSGPVRDLGALGAELRRPTLLGEELFRTATSVAFPGLRGVLPGFGRHEAQDWGLGFEIRDRKSPHWTGSRNSPATFGHFGRSGAFLWVDPAADVALAVLSDREFGPWAADAWPALSDAVLAGLVK